MDFSILGFGDLAQISNLHHLALHFPTALIPAALLFYFLGASLQSPRFCFGGLVTLWLAVIGGAAVVWSGYQLQSSEGGNALLQTHQSLAAVVLGVSAVMALWGLVTRAGIPKAPWLFVAVLVVTSLAALQSAELGRRLGCPRGAQRTGITLQPSAPAKERADGKAPPSADVGTPGQGDETHSSFATD